MHYNFQNHELALHFARVAFLAPASIACRTQACFTSHLSNDQVGGLPLVARMARKVSIVCLIIKSATGEGDIPRQRTAVIQFFLFVAGLVLEVMNVHLNKKHI